MQQPALQLQRRIQRAQLELAVDHADQGVAGSHAGIGEHDVAVVAAADQDHLALGQLAAGTGVQPRHDAQQPALFLFARVGRCVIHSRLHGLRH